eukprot:403347035
MSEAASSPSEAYNHFVKLNQTLLNCYADTNPILYRMMSNHEQKNFCYSERLTLENYLQNGKVSQADFFRAARDV